MAPKYDGTYKYSKLDFEDDGKIPISKKTMDIQNNKFSFEFSKNIPEYKITFGNKRNLAKGIITLYSDGKWYSTHPIGDEKTINFKSINEISEFEFESSNKFPNLKGKSSRITVNWTLENETINLITHFDLYKNCFFKTEDPDLRSSEVTIENINLILFTIEFPDGISNCSTNDYTINSINYPCFKNQSPNNRMYSFKNVTFAPGYRGPKPTTSPRIFFDDNLNTFAVSSADNFMVHTNSVNNKWINCGLEGEIKSIPKGHTYSYMLIFDSGINNTLQKIGDLLREFHNKKRKSMYMDKIISYIGYWTDNGAYYYYRPIKGKKLSETLLEVNKHSKELDIPFQYFDLDSWWYLKSVSKLKRKLLGNLGRIVGGGLYGGAIKWEIDPFYMHMDVSELSKQLDNKPFIAHHRWYNVNSPRLNQYKFVSEGTNATSIDPDFWEMIMENCQKWNIICFEQDWMSLQLDNIKDLRNNVENADKWLNCMGDAAIKYDRTIQYCMAKPGMFTNSLKHDAVSHARTSEDYHPRWPRSYDYRVFVQSNMLASAMRLWPFKDVFRSTCEGPINGEKMPEFMALVSTLGCGPVGFGDKIGNIGVESVRRVCRRDGLILKPDFPITVADSMFVPHTKYFITNTYSDINDRRWDYILVNKLRMRQPKDKTITLTDVGIEESKIAYNYFNNTFHVFDENQPLMNNLKGQGYNYWIAAPLIKEGFTLIGDISKFVPMSFKEFKSLIIKDNLLIVEIDNVTNESVKLMMFDENKIQSISVAGEIISKSNTDLSKLNQISNEKTAWYFDSKINASLLVYNFKENSMKKVEISL
ncbi:MAG: hypothetical protein GY870_12305 [archaeon]|nr:hypothetical protein [archaeon]